MFYDPVRFVEGAISSLVIFSTVHYILSIIISCDDQRQRWKRINISTSFIHSISSSVMSIYWFVDGLIKYYHRLLFDLV